MVLVCSTCIYEVKHVKNIGKHCVFVACMHHAREPVVFLCEKGLVVESGAVFDDEDDHDDDHNNPHGHQSEDTLLETLRNAHHLHHARSSDASAGIAKRKQFQ